MHLNNEIMLIVLVMFICSRKGLCWFLLYLMNFWHGMMIYGVHADIYKTVIMLFNFVMQPNYHKITVDWKLVQKH